VYTQNVNRIANNDPSTNRNEVNRVAIKMPPFCGKTRNFGSLNWNRSFKFRASLKKQPNFPTLLRQSIRHF